MFASAIEFFKHGLAIEPLEPSVEDKKMIQEMASRAGVLAFPMFLFAEALQPVAGLLSHAFTALEPVGELVVGLPVYRKLSAMLSQPKHLEALIASLEEKGFPAQSGK